MGQHRSAFPHPSKVIWHGRRGLLRWAGDAQQEGNDAMPMHRAIGFSLACLLTPACTATTAPEHSTTDHPSEFPGVTPGNPGLPTINTKTCPAGLCRKLNRLTIAPSARRYGAPLSNPEPKYAAVSATPVAARDARLELGCLDKLRGTNW